MSNQMFVFLLFMEGAILCIGMILYFFIKRKEPLALISSVVNGLFALFFWLLGGGIKDQQQAGILIYRTALGLLFSQAALIVIVSYYLIICLFGKANRRE